MSSNITFLKWSGGSLTKTFGTADPSVPEARALSSREVVVDDIVGFHAALVEGATRGEAMFTGRFPTPIKNESRAGKNDKRHKRNWVCIDIDDLQGHTIESFVSLFKELEGVSYCYHYSSSHGMTKTGLNAHIFFMVDKHLTSEEQLTWLEGINLDDSLSSLVSLSAVGTTLRMPIDRTMSHVSRLIYIAPPLFAKNCELSDPLGDDKRYGLVLKDNAVIEWDSVPMQRKNRDVVRSLKLAVLNNLREGCGLSRVTDAIDLSGLKPTAAHGIAILPRAEVDVDGKTVVRCDISRKLPNGEVLTGDRMSWWFDKDFITDATLLYNFKGEPPLKLLESNPEFANKWNQDLAEKSDPLGDIPDYLRPHTKREDAKRASRFAVKGAWENNRASFLVDIDRNYYIGVRPDHTGKRLLIEDVSRMTAPNYANNHNIVYDPKTTFDVAKRAKVQFTLSPPTLVFKDKNGDYVLNTAYIPDMLLTERTTRIKPTDLCRVMEKDTPYLYRYLMHTLSSEDYFNRFVNWVAAKIRGVHSSTAWLFRGVPGSGKSSVVRILGQLLTDNDPNAPNPCMTVTMAHLLDDKNGWLERSVFIEGAEFNDRTLQGKDRTRLKEMLKMLIDAPEIPVRKMQKDTRMVRNNTAWIFTSNEGIPFELPEDDRRYETPPYVRTQAAEAFEELSTRNPDGTLQLPPQFFDSLIASELPMLGEILMSVDIDTRWLAHSANSEDKAALVSSSLYGEQVMFNWIRKGKLDALASAVLESLDPMDASTEAVHVRDLLEALYKDPTITTIPRTHANSLYKVLFPKSKTAQSDIAIARAYTSAQMPAVRRRANSLKGFNLTEDRVYAVVLRPALAVWECDGDSDMHAMIRGTNQVGEELDIPEFLRKGDSDARSVH